MPATVPIRRVKNRAAREEALVSAASKLFARRGYEPTTTREIAAEAGCAEGLIHRYFGGKAGLLLALIRSRISQEVADINAKVPRAARLDDDLLHVMAYELQRVWDDREALKVIVPRAILDPQLGNIVRKTGPIPRARLLIARFKQFDECKGMSRRELEAFADFVGIVGFMYGFIRPGVLWDKRSHSRSVALTMAKILVQGITRGTSTR